MVVLREKRPEGEVPQEHSLMIERSAQKLKLKERWMKCFVRKKV